MIRMMQEERLAGLIVGELMVVDTCSESSAAQADDCQRYRVQIGHRATRMITARELDELANGMLALTAGRIRRAL